ncbi:MAG: hypothetical protein J6C33_07300 [Lachnospiraceae bacterium]|nr:hypothetical protein [Lachnospiraceae bacterium]
MAHKKNYIFTNKEHPQKGIMSTILGIISAASIALTLYFTFLNGGSAQPRYGAAALFAVLFAAAGLALGIMSKMEPDKYYLFSYLGIIINSLVLAGVGFILFAGAYGI